VWQVADLAITGFAQAGNLRIHGEARAEAFCGASGDCVSVLKYYALYVRPTICSDNPYGELTTNANACCSVFCNHHNCNCRTECVFGFCQTTCDTCADSCPICPSFLGYTVK
jgi:hypothetical protein